MALIYVLEDDKNIREIESFALKNSGHLVIEFENGKEFYKKALEHVPDLAIMDIMLPDEDGLEILKRLRTVPETRLVPVIMVTAKTTELDKVRGLDLGADDYLTKPFGVMELISRVKALLRRSQGFETSKILRLGTIVLDNERHVVCVDDEVCELTYKEFELLHLFMLNQGIVLKRDLIMERIWSLSYEGESRTLDVHIKSLRKKLKEAGSYIKTIRNVGYMLEAE